MARYSRPGGPRYPAGTASPGPAAGWLLITGGGYPCPAQDVQYSSKVDKSFIGSSHASQAQQGRCEISGAGGR